METLLDGAQISQLLTAIADEIAADDTFQLKSPAKTSPPVALVGIRSRGELLANRLAALLAARSGTPHTRIDAGALDTRMQYIQAANSQEVTPVNAQAQLKKLLNKGEAEDALGLGQLRHHRGALRAGGRTGGGAAAAETNKIKRYSATIFPAGGCIYFLLF